MVEEVFLTNKDDINAIKERVVKILYRKKMPQSKIADFLNISQPMVSIYCKSKKKANNHLNEITGKIAEGILRGKKVNFQTCVTFSNKKLEGHFFIADKNEILTDENSKILENLKQAFYNLKGKDISRFAPKIKINIAMAKKNLKNYNDVASFLDELIISDGKITGYNEIRFGKSEHLSSLLTKYGNKLDKKAIMNIAYSKKLEDTKYKIGFLNKDFSLKKPSKDYDILLHKGDFGIEPCAYILGKDAVEISNKLLEIIGEIDNEK